ncbi:KLHL31 [Branchiostoma lanceolatum]|uniref:KLHL31 protein n=2 Tax=Branchiostoma lanceolatum TaxID=7740 RepID=A0A8K0EY61_BRALA|nr:KLHL31 [Branchiostoma lanceolatum]
MVEGSAYNGHSVGNQRMWVERRRMEKVNERKFSLASHGASVLSGFRELYQTELLSDVCLVAENREFRSHKTLLAACCPYFRSMFSIDLREKEETTIEMHGTTARGLAAILDFLYSGDLTLNDENKEDVLSTACYLQVDAVIDMCCSYLRENIHMKNCIGIWNLACALNLHDLKDFAENHVTNNLIEASQSDDFLELSCDQLIVLLSNDWVKATDRELCEMSDKWVAGDPKRSEYLDEISSILNIDSIPAEDNFGIPATRPLGGELVARRHDSVETIRDSTICRASREVVLAVGGRLMYNERPAVQRTCVSFCDVRSPDGDQPWYEMTQIPIRRRNYCAAVLDDEIYVVGGREWDKEARGYDRWSAAAFCYNLRTAKWREVSSLSTKRSCFSMDAIEGNLFAVGGDEDHEDTSILSSVERFDPIQNLWWPCSEIPDGRRCQASCVYNGRLYVSGGWIKRTEAAFSLTLNVNMSCIPTMSATVYCYEPLTDMWLERSAMHVARFSHAMEVYSGRIFAIGGYTSLSRTHNEPLDVVECYSPEQDQWSFIEPLRVPAGLCSALVVEGKMTILGGDQSTFSGEMSYVSKVQVYDEAAREWTVSNTLRYPGPVPAYKMMVPGSFIEPFRVEKHLADQVGPIGGASRTF